jgi:hypothetical protein
MQKGLKMAKRDTMTMVALSIASIFLFGGFIYGTYWVAKTVSYKVFYADMVEQTIKDTVRPEALR